LKGVKTRVYPVGRLDYNTEGLLLLTNDGDFAHLITHPKHEFPKTYLAKVKGVLEDGMIDMLEKGVFLQDGKTAPAKIRKIRKEEANSWVEITIHEGRKRQVRRMFDHVGRSVIKLKRVRTGTLSLGDLPEGRFRHLTLDEVNALRETAMKTDDSGQQVRVYKPVIKAPRAEGDVRRRPMDAGRVGRPGARVMHDTREGLRKNQRTRPDQGVRLRQSDAGRSEHKQGVAARGISGQRPRVMKPGFEGSRNTWTGRKPRPEERRARTAGPGPRAGKAYGASKKPITGRPATGTGTWKSERSRPGQGFSSRGPERGTSFEGRRPSSGPRPNKSRYSGSKGPARGARPGPKGRGQGAGNRGPRR
jgi:23S rRNA pseudouridine2605 synthase